MELTIQSAARLLGRGLRRVRGRAFNRELQEDRAGEVSVDVTYGGMTDGADAREITDCGRPTPLAEVLASLYEDSGLHVALAPVRGELHDALMAVREAERANDPAVRGGAIGRARAAVQRAEVQLRLTGHGAASPWLKRLQGQVKPAVADWSARAAG